jgi:LysR family hydrogen peroxide-inducible transcriptional activator
MDRACSNASAIVVAGIVSLDCNLGACINQWLATLRASKPCHPIHSAYRYHDVKAWPASERECYHCGGTDSSGYSVEIHEIRYFLAVAETLNFTRAAERCHVSQPALTRAIQHLEGKLGGPLVHRERGNTHLTELGRIMLPHCREVLQQMEQAHKRAKSFCTLEKTRLTIGLMCTIGPHRLVDLFATFREANSGAEVYIKDAPAGQLEESLIKGDIDIAVFCRPEEPDDRFHTLSLFRERFVIAVGPGHPFERLNAVRLRDLHQHNYLARANCEYKDYLRAIRETIGGIELKRPYTSERDDWIQCMVLAGLGFTYIPEYAVTVRGLITRPLIEPEVYRTVSLVTVRGRPHSPAVGAFLRTAKRIDWANAMQSTNGMLPAPAATASHSLHATS